MTTFLWNPTWETGVVFIDEQHRELFNRMAMFSDRLATRKAVDENTGLLDLAAYLQEYVDFHFRDEEALMGQIGYPDLEEHQRVHREMRAQLETLLADHLQDKELLAFDLMGFLVSWLLDHINGHDRKVANYIYCRPLT